MTHEGLSADRSTNVDSARPARLGERLQRAGRALVRAVRSVFSRLASVRAAWRRDRDWRAHRVHPHRPGEDAALPAAAVHDDRPRLRADRLDTGIRALSMKAAGTHRPPTRAKLVSIAIIVTALAVCA